MGQVQRYLDQLMDRAENLRPEDQDGQVEARASSAVTGHIFTHAMGRRAGPVASSSLRT